jgi:predicted AAA+ superfamily ATPase
MHDRRKRLLLFLDEVQESPNWEAELKSLYDNENLKMICTGSTASLIKTQGGKLTGRQMISTIYPLDFKEFLRFRNVTFSHAEEYKLEREVEEYLNIGGYPENVINPSEEYLYTLINDIIARDIVRLYQVKKANFLRDLLRLLASSVGSRTSFNKLAHVLGLSVDTVKEYIGYLESAFLVKALEKWTTSFSERVYAYRKYYLFDTGLKTALTVSGDTGFKAENAVFMHLCKKNKDLGYFAESEREVDFITGTYRKPFPIEVKYGSGFDWKNKKFAGMKLFLHRFPKVKKALIVTRDTGTQIKEDSVTAVAVPLWKYLLDETIPI